MDNAMRGARRRTTGGFILLMLLLALGLAPRAEAAKFYHATFGPIEVYTSDSPDNTKRLVGELLEVRRRIQELVGPVPLPTPRMQILVFSRQKDYEEFLPAKAGWDTNTTTISGFTSGEQALVAAVVREGQAYGWGQETLRYFYAQFLLDSALPGAPLWIRAGVPEFLASTDYRGARIYAGGDFMHHLGNVPLSKLMPLSRLMDDREVEQYYGASRHDNVLYHESWALWHRWLTDPTPRRREQINRLFAAIREGREGDLATVMECFGETAESLEAGRRTSARGKGFTEVVSNAEPAALVAGMEFKPATMLDGRFAQALLAGGARRGPAQLGYDLYRLADAEPTSPRPAEALAILAMGEQETAVAEARWEKARDLGTDNAFAYLLPAREALANRVFSLAPRSQLPEAQTVEWRRYLARAVELNPGCVDAQYFRMLVETFAVTPDPAVIDAIANSQVLSLRPQGYIYLAIARWRLGQLQAAKDVLTALQGNRRLDRNSRHHVELLLKAIRKDEAAKK